MDEQQKNQTPRRRKTLGKTAHNRTEMLSVKASTAEKYRIVEAAKRYDMSYSEFVRYVVLNACSAMGVEAPAGVTSEDVRARRTPQQRKAASTVSEKAAA